MAEHTPGPWHIERGERLVTTKAIVIHGPQYKQSGDLGPVAFATTPNATLIAAAPDLYDALAELLEIAEAGEHPSTLAWGMAAAALAKARGTSE